MRPTVWTVYRWELRKLRSQKRTYLGLGAAAVVPIIFVVAVSLQNGRGPEDVAFGRYIHDSGLAIPLVLLLFGAIWMFPLITALVAGDIVAAEEADGTMKTILTRSLRRRHVLTGKLLALYTYVAFAMAAFFVVATGAAMIAWGIHPLVNLSGTRLSPAHALALDVPAVLVYLMPVLAIASFGLLLSVLTRQSVAAVGGTLIYAMALQGVAVIQAIAAAHPYLLTNQLTAWHGLFQTPIDGGMILRAAWVSAAFAVPPLVAAFAIFSRRDVTS
jgi:ABC-2 type transport system permease protein